MSIESRKLLSHIDETVNCKVEIPGTEQFYIRSREKNESIGYLLQSLMWNHHLQVIQLSIY